MHIKNFRDKYLFRIYGTIFIDTQDAIALGEILLSSSSQHSVFVDTNLPGKLQDTLFTFMLHKPGRSGGGFPLMAESADSMKKWLSVLQEAISSAVEICDPSVISTEYDDDIYATIDSVAPPVQINRVIAD